MFSAPIEIRFRDLDSLGHVNHAVVATYLEQIRVQWWQGFLGGRPFLEEGFVMAHLAMDYHVPILFGDRFRVEQDVTRVGNASFSLRARVIRESDGLLLVDSTSVGVMVDEAERRPRPIGAEARAWLEGQLA